MNHIRELHGILDEKYGNVVANNVPVALLGVELDREATYISNSVGRATTTENCREAEEDWSLARGVGENACGSNVCGRLEKSEFAKGTRATGMNNTLWNTFVIKTVNL